MSALAKPTTISLSLAWPWKRLQDLTSAPLSICSRRLTAFSFSSSAVCVLSISDEHDLHAAIVNNLGQVIWISVGFPLQQQTWRTNYKRKNVNFKDLFTKTEMSMLSWVLRVETAQNSLKIDKKSRNCGFICQSKPLSFW